MYSVYIEEINGDFCKERSPRTYRKCSATVEFNSLLYNDTEVSSSELSPKLKVSEIHILKAKSNFTSYTICFNSRSFFFGCHWSCSGHAFSVESKQITDEILLKLPEIGVLELVKHCYCFNSKRDNFIVKRLCYCHLLSTRERSNILQAILWTINGLSGFVFTPGLH